VSVKFLGFCKFLKLIKLIKKMPSYFRVILLITLAITRINFSINKTYETMTTY